MKKIALLLVSALLLTGVTANAQHAVVKAGFNYTNASVESLKAGKTGWQVGVGFQVPQTKPWLSTKRWLTWSWGNPFVKSRHDIL